MQPLEGRIVLALGTMAERPLCRFLAATNSIAKRWPLQIF
jgi:hypothetical protein